MFKTFISKGEKAKKCTHLCSFVYSFVVKYTRSRNLHWLPVRYRIRYKILLITYKAITEMAPDYLCSLIFIKASARSLRSSKLKSYGDKSFSVVGPVLWNRLPESVKSAKTINHFKSLLKTYLFDAAFNSN